MMGARELARAELRREAARLQKLVAEQVPYLNGPRGRPLAEQATVVLDSYDRDEMERAERFEQARQDRRRARQARDAALRQPVGSPMFNALLPAAEKHLVRTGVVPGSRLDQTIQKRAEEAGAALAPTVEHRDGLWWVRCWPGWSTSDETLARAVAAQLDALGLTGYRGRCPLHRS